MFYVSLAKRLVKFGKFLKYTVSPIKVQAYLSLLIFRTKLWQPCETIGKFENFSNIGHLVPKTQRGSSEKLMRLVRHEYYWHWRLNISFVLCCFCFFFSGFFARPVQSFPVQWYRNPHVCVTVVPDAVYREVSTTYGLPHHGSLSLSCKESSFVTFSSCWGHIHSLLQGLDSFQIILLLRLKVRYVWSLRKEENNLQCFSFFLSCSLSVSFYDFFVCFCFCCCIFFVLTFMSSIQSYLFYFSQGMCVIFQVALALLKVS